MDKRRQIAKETDIYAYDVFELLFEYEITRVKRYPSPLALLHIALEKKNYPADFISQANKAMTGILCRSLRVSDVPAHYNDEFLVLLPATDEDGGRAVAERILSHFRTTQSLATGRLSPKRNAYIGLTVRIDATTVSVKNLLAEAAVAMNEARTKQSYTYVLFSDISTNAPKL